MEQRKKAQKNLAKNRNSTNIERNASGFQSSFSIFFTQGSHFSGLTKFPDFSSIFCHFCHPQRSWGKVMFSQACVILFTGGGVSASVHAGTPPQEQTPPRADPTPQSRHPPRADTPPEQTPPQSRHPEQTPPRVDTPQSRHLPGSRHPPLEQTPPLV